MSSTITDTLAINGGTPVRTKGPLPWPVHGPEEERRLVDVVRSGEWWWGKNVREFEEKFAAFQGAKFGITACNGTISLQIILRALGVTAGDEVIVPGYTFIASATAVTQINAIPVLSLIHI